MNQTMFQAPYVKRDLDYIMTKAGKKNRSSKQFSYFYFILWLEHNQHVQSSERAALQNNDSMQKDNLIIAKYDYYIA